MSPQEDWEANEPERLSKTFSVLKTISSEAGSSLADTIILAGNLAIEEAASAAGYNLIIPFKKGRGDASKLHPITATSVFLAHDIQNRKYKNFFLKKAKYEENGSDILRYSGIYSTNKRWPNTRF